MPRKAAYEAHKSYCRHEKTPTGKGGANSKATDLYYRPKPSDGYLVKRTNWVNWDTLDKEIYKNFSLKGRKHFRDGSPTPDLNHTVSYDPHIPRDHSPAGVAGVTGDYSTDNGRKHFLPPSALDNTRQQHNMSYEVPRSGSPNFSLRTDDIEGASPNTNTHLSKMAM